MRRKKEKITRVYKADLSRDVLQDGKMRNIGKAYRDQCVADFLSCNRAYKLSQSMWYILTPMDKKLPATAVVEVDGELRR